MLRYLIAFLIVLPVATAAEPPVERKMLKNGLVASYTEMPERPSTTSIHRLEPAVALLLKPGEAMHPGQPRTSTSKWVGYLQIVTAGEYTFSANAQAGQVDVGLLANEKYIEVLKGDAPLDQTGMLNGQPVKLEPGFYRFSATFDFFRGKSIDNFAMSRRFELLWQGPGFQREPIPWFFFGHLPSQRPAKFETDARHDQGRFLFEEHACIKCHLPSKDDAMAKTLSERMGPDLTKICERVYAGWLDAWLADPAKLRPHTTMPKMFGDDEAGVAERYAVVQYLLSHGRPLKEAKAKLDGGYMDSLKRGQTLFTTTGCAACHGPKLAGTMKRNDDDDEPPPYDPLNGFYAFGTHPQSRYALGGVGSKTTAEQLAKYLLNPLKTNPHGRMPNMGLNDGEARDLARHLMRYMEESIISRTKVAEPKWTPAQLSEQVLKNKEMREGVAKQSPEKQWQTLGEFLFIRKGCINCHAVQEIGGVQVKSYPSLAAIQKSSDKGCLAEKPANVRYSFDPTQRNALQAFVQSTANDVGTAAPAYQTRAAIKRFNCLACHQKDGEGGLGNELADAMKRAGGAASEDDVAPPRLTGIGHKATTAWLESVLTKGGRARPWMPLRMPQYGEGVNHLVTGLSACEGLLPDTAATKPLVSAAMIEQGRKLVGKEGLGCVACHDISGYVGGGTRGPDLALTDRRVRHEWYDRWMHNPQRLAPGTKMPSNFTDGRSVSNLLGADAQKQTDALWAYFTLGPGLPLPAGLEVPTTGLPLVVKDRPEVMRTFMPDNAGTRPVAVGFPNGAGSYCFDTHAGRLVYAWEGNFLDMKPVWESRGGNQAKLLGQKYIVTPLGQPWAVTNGESPDFAKRAGDYSFGAPLPFDTHFLGPMRVHFDGYTLDAAGAPTFRYHVDDSKGESGLSVSEIATPLRGAIGSGLTRSFTIERPAGKTVWLNVATLAKPMRKIGNAILLPQENDKAIAVAAVTLPEDAEWTTDSDGKLAAIKFPPTKDGVKSQVAFTLWALARDDDELLKALK